MFDNDSISHISDMFNDEGHRDKDGYLKYKKRLWYDELGIHDVVSHKKAINQLLAETENALIEMFDISPSGNKFGVTSKEKLRNIYYKDIPYPENYLEEEIKYIYVVGIDGLPDYFKIGYTKNIKQRISQIQTHHPTKIKLVMAQACFINPEKVERYLHWTLSEFNIRGEWFKLDEKGLSVLRHGFLSTDSLLNVTHKFSNISNHKLFYETSVDIGFGIWDLDATNIYQSLYREILRYNLNPSQGNNFLAIVHYCHIVNGRKDLMHLLPLDFINQNNSERDKYWKRLLNIINEIHERTTVMRMYIEMKKITPERKQFESQKFYKGMWDIMKEIE